MPQLPLKNPFQIYTKNSTRPNCTFSCGFRPIYIVSRVFGQMPFSIEFDSNGVIHRPAIKMLDALWFLISIICYICITYFAFDYFRSDGSFNPLLTFSYVGNNFVFGICIINGLLAIVLDMCFRFVFVDAFKKIIVFDQKASLNV